MLPSLKQRPEAVYSIAGCGLAASSADAAGSNNCMQSRTARSSARVRAAHALRVSKFPFIFHRQVAALADLVKSEVTGYPISSAPALFGPVS